MKAHRFIPFSFPLLSHDSGFCVSGLDGVEQSQGQGCLDFPHLQKKSHAFS